MLNFDRSDQSSRSRLPSRGQIFLQARICRRPADGRRVNRNVSTDSWINFHGQLEISTVNRWISRFFHGKMSSSGEEVGTPINLMSLPKQAEGSYYENIRKKNQ